MRWLAPSGQMSSTLSVIPAMAPGSPLPVLRNWPDCIMTNPPRETPAPNSRSAAIVAVVAAIVVSVLQPVSLFAQDGPSGITTPTVLPRFDPNRPVCARPAGLERVLAFAQDNGRKFMEGVARGLALAAKDRGLEYRVEKANNEPAKMIDQVRALLDAKVGALVIAPIDPPSIAPVLKQVLWSGAYVGAVVPPPATTVLNAPQYLTGKVLGEEAAAYIRTHLRGKAK